MGTNAFGQSVLRKEDTRLAHRPRSLHRRRHPPRLRARRDDPQPARARRHPADRHRRRACRARRARGADRRGVGGGRAGGYPRSAAISSACPARPRHAGFEHRPAHPVLARGVVRYVGDSVAMVVAETEAAARDGAELLAVDYEIAPFGDGHGDGRRARVRPPCGTTRPRTSASAGTPAMPRRWIVHSNAQRAWCACVSSTTASMSARWRRAARWASTTRAPSATRSPLARRCRIRSSRRSPPRCGGFRPIRFASLIADVGGSFGIKNALYPEQALVLWAARRVGRPVAWIGERADGFLSDYQARDNVSTGELALDADGRFLGLRVRTHRRHRRVSRAQGPAFADRRTRPRSPASTGCPASMSP